MKTRNRNIHLRIRYKRRSDLAILAALLILALATAVFLTTLTWGPEQAAAGAQAAPAAFTPMRKYYLTQGGYDGDETLTACASGYHMASLWEILDPSNLEYNTDLGRARADSGAGPPAAYWGWVRTGWGSENNTGIPGQDNCLAWSDDGFGRQGTAAVLINDWTGDWEDMHVWSVSPATCSLLQYVWCVEDYPSSVHLPLVLRNH